MKYAAIFSVACIALVLSQQQCSVYKNSGLKGASKIKDQTNMCDNYLTPSDLSPLAPDSQITLSSTTQMQGSEAVEVCSIDIEDEITSTCKVGQTYKDMIYDEVDESNTLTMFSYGYEYTYFHNDSQGSTDLYIYMSDSNSDEYEFRNGKGVMCRGDIADEVEDSIIFQIATAILENLYDNYRSQQQQ